MLSKLITPLRTLFVRAKEIVRSFSASGRALFYLLALLIIGSSLSLLFIINEGLKVDVPVRGGSYSEGVIGTPRFINPILAISDVDQDLVALTYAGLLKESPDNTMVPDMAEGYDVSQDGKTYTVHIDRTARFQDGTPVTADDVVFTINKALDPAIKSPRRADWEGVQVSEIDPYTVQFTLAKPYAPFVDNLSMGILPKHLWQNVSAEEFPFSELNTTPVGSGPYQVTSVSRTSSGIPSSYTLTAFANYTLGAPYITTFTLRFYQNESLLVSALQHGDVEAGSAISPASLSDLHGLSGSHAISIPLNRVFGVFFNQNQSTVLRDKTVRQALSTAIDRSALVAQVLGNYGSPLTGPIPPSLLGQTGITQDGSNAAAAPAQSDASTTDPIAAARTLLINAGWKPGPDGVLQKSVNNGKFTQTVRLAFSLATGNVDELTSAAQFVKDAWTRMGADVTVNVYDQGDLSENVIRPRKYDALLFGEIVGRGLDLYAFWHSSERNDPGLNIAMYANPTVDALLEKLRAADDDSSRQSILSSIATQINNDQPAVFLYSPDFVYVTPDTMKGMSFGIIEDPSDRFATVARWYNQTDSVWKVFAR